MANLSYLRHHLIRDTPDDHLNNDRHSNRQAPYFPSSDSDPARFNIRTFEKSEYEEEEEEDGAVSDHESVILHRENQVSFVMDLFQDQVEQSQVIMGRPPDPFVESGFGVVVDEEEGDEENCDLGAVPPYLELDLGSELGFGLDGNIGNRNVIEEDDDADDFFLETRVSNVPEESSEAESTVSVPANGVRIVGFGSDSDVERELDNDDPLGIGLRGGEDEYGLGNLNYGGVHYDEDGEGDDDVSVSIPLCWDSLQLEEEHNRENNNDDFEWEEVDGRSYEREVLSVLVDEEEGEPEEEEEASISVSISPIIAPEDLVSVERGGELGNLEWEVLLNANNLDSNPDRDLNVETYFGGDHEDFYVHPVEYDTLFGHFTENEIGVMGRPPAAKSVVENLQSVVLMKEDVEDGNVLCAVCKDEIDVGERAKQLPCSHRYHGECIVPWLGIRNTCPVCRYELPTDDADYERRKAAQRVVISAAGRHL